MEALNAPHGQPKSPYKGKTWTEVYTSLISADRQRPLPAEDLYTLSLAAYLTGKDSDSVDLFARAHHQFLERNDHKQAVRCAFWIGLQLMFRGEQAKGSGWFSRAQHLLENISFDCAEKGLLSIPAALKLLNGGHAEKAYTIFTKAVNAGNKFNDPDLSTLSLLGCGQSLIILGKVPDGMAMLDESMVAVSSDKVSPIVLGVVYCAVIETCQTIFDTQRAQEWTKVLSRWCEAQRDLVPFRGQCLVRRSQIMHLHGDWTGALKEMQRACTLLAQPPGEPAAGEAFYQLADIYRLRGEFTHAEKLYQEANKWGRKPQPGLALLRVGLGQPVTAATAIQHTLDETENPVQRIRILAAYIEIMIAACQVLKAELAADELSDLAASYNTPYLHAVSASCHGAVYLEKGNPGKALKMLRNSCNLWNELNAPYQAARVRVLMATAYRKKEDEDSCSMELSAAQWIFRQLEAMPDLQMVESLLKEKQKPDLHGLTLREIQVLHLVAAGETNKTIAGKLFISERTVERHLSNIFSKLEVDSRTAAAAYAYQHHML